MESRRHRPGRSNEGSRPVTRSAHGAGGAQAPTTPVPGEERTGRSPRPRHDMTRTAAHPKVTGHPGYNVTLPCEEASAAEAKRLVRTALSAWALDHLADASSLMVCELVANAVRHTRSRSIRVQVDRPSPGWVRLAVVDKSSRTPCPVEAAVAGVGLAIAPAVGRDASRHGASGCGVVADLCSFPPFLGGREAGSGADHLVHEPGPLLQDARLVGPEVAGAAMHGPVTAVEVHRGAAPFVVGGEWVVGVHARHGA